MDRVIGRALWGRGREGRGRGGRRPLDEADALLAGTYLELLAREHLDIPAWSALNRAAHADLASLRSAAARGDPEAPVGSGEAAEASGAARAIAEELTDLVGEDADLLLFVQTLVLVPLELRLMSPTEEEPPSLAQVVEAARSLLRSTRC